MFTHLHLHTKYSFLDGLIKPEELFPKLKELGMNSVAITDHGNMHGIVSFYNESLKNNIKLIIGIEAYICQDMAIKENRKDNNHLVLLAKNNIGYKNLCILSSKSWLEGFYYKPRIDKKILKKYSEGIICLSACLGGEIPRAITNGDLELAESLISQYKDIFKDDFYLELQINNLKEQEIVNEALIKLSKKSNTQLIASNDVHYLNKDQHCIQDALFCVFQNKKISDENRMKHEFPTFYLRSEDEMRDLFSVYGQDGLNAIENTNKVAGMCNVKLDLGRVVLPDCNVENMAAIDVLTIKAKRGLEKKGLYNNNIYLERLEYELSVIAKTGFAGYFLIVADFINWAKDNGLTVGPGRGSGVGSLTAYCLNITSIDPIPYDLLFERFLNPDRVSMPDFDIDFSHVDRDMVIGYVSDKYKNVAQIATFGTIKAKSAIRDAARVLDIPVAVADKLAKMVPIDFRTIKEKEYSDIRETIKNNSEYRSIIKIAWHLEGLYRQVGKHACGIVIGDKELYNYTPLFKDKDGNMVTQYDKDDVEKVGLVKFDFLGLKTLTVIKNCCNMTGVRIEEIDLNDKAAYEMFKKSCKGIFQMESSGFEAFLHQLCPDNIHEIAAAVALYRPGPINIIPSYIKRKLGEEKITYSHPSLEMILKETYGLIVYQEQVMKISQIIAGFTLAKADILRKAMGKKKKDEMVGLKNDFMVGAKNNNIKACTAETIFNYMEKFADYGFNKSHAVAYGLISYQTAYLKAHYPVEFFCSLISVEFKDSDKVYMYINDAREMGIDVLPPDINESEIDFSIKNNKIRFGLAAIKNVGKSALKFILKERKGGNFPTFCNFLSRINLSKVNVRNIEYLIKAGCFSYTGKSKDELIHILPIAVKEIRKAIKKNIPIDIEALEKIELIEGLDYNETGPYELLKFEKDALGIYITNHPINVFLNGRRNAKSIAEAIEAHKVESLGYNDENWILGIIGTDIKPKKSKNGNYYLSGIIEDSEDFIDFVYYGIKDVENNKGLKIMGEGRPIMINVNVKIDEDEVKVFVRDVKKTN